MNLDSPLYCEHANENPRTCPCDPDCYCKTRTCRSTSYLPPSGGQLLAWAMGIGFSERLRCEAGVTQEIVSTDPQQYAVLSQDVYPTTARTYTFVKMVNGFIEAQNEKVILARTVEGAFQLFLAGWLRYRASHPGDLLLIRAPLHLHTFEDPTRDGVQYFLSLRFAIGDSHPDGN